MHSFTPTQIKILNLMIRRKINHQRRYQVSTKKYCFLIYQNQKTKNTYIISKIFQYFPREYNRSSYVEKNECINFKSYFLWFCCNGKKYCDQNLKTKKNNLGCQNLYIVLKQSFLHFTDENIKISLKINLIIVASTKFKIHIFLLIRNLLIKSFS